MAHPELDLISTELSAERFGKLTEQVDVALSAARDAKDAVVTSFDILILRTEHRTNEIVKVLTLASLLLLPGALIAGVMGMNVNFSGATFAHSPLFWVVLAAIVSTRRCDARSRQDADAGSEPARVGEPPHRDALEPSTRLVLGPCPVDA